ncbi:hypothetical protein ACEWY4_026020 [Coilia grayii]|uniref:IRG-type G domain-containing protein n=1 Tax=Coilia grayii TaxID=363190 RepID=A0ABD1ITM5_9TELE
MYPHPVMPNVKIFDLPGIGSSHFKAKTYLKDVKFKNYDFFIIVSASRFKENDITLANEIKKKKKNFYFVRSKIDVDKAGSSSPIFLITSHDLNRFDFKDLVETLESDLPDHKKDALVLSLPVYSMQSLAKKYNTFMRAAWAVAVVSGGIAAAPVPGLSFTCNIAMVASFLTKCYFSFGLNEKALKKLSQRVNKPILLEEVKKSLLVQAIGRTSMLTTKMAARLGAAGVIEALSSFVPFAGSLTAAGVSFVTTRYVLQEVLNELHRKAKHIIEMAELE